MSCKLRAILPKPHEVYVWRAQISRETLQNWRSILSTDEQDRARSFRLADDRYRFTVARVLLRVILGTYLELAPESLRFLYSERGKPSLDKSSSAAGITFNVSHSGPFCLLAFGMNLELGIDVEHLQIERDVDALAKSLLSPTEYHQLLVKPHAARKVEFLKAWTRKEAASKALGVGISMLPHTYERMVASAEWTVRNIDIGNDCVAAVAAHTPNMQIRMRDCAI